MPKPITGDKDYDIDTLKSETGLSYMRQNAFGRAIAIVCSDLHLSHKPPIWRSAEPDWYEAMYRSLTELRTLRMNLQDDDACPVLPILCAGDVFDKWNSPPQLINFAMKALPKMYSIPGQHDIPNHNHDEMDKSAYRSLEGIRLFNAEYAKMMLPELNTDWYAWEQDIPARTEEYEGICIIHRYVWSGNCKFPGAPPTSNAKVIAKEYDSRLVVCGDNHKGFYAEKYNVFNCGGFFRRNSDQVVYQPRVGIVYENMKVIPYYLNIKEDVHIPTMMAKELESIQDNAESWINRLRNVEICSYDYRIMMEDTMRKNNVLKEIRNYLLGVLDDES